MFRNHGIGGKIIEKTAQIVKSGRISLSGGYEKDGIAFLADGFERLKTKPKPSEAGSVWKGGAAE